MSSLHKNSRSGVPVPHNSILSTNMPYLPSKAFITSSFDFPLSPSTGRFSKSALTACMLFSYKHLAKYTLRIIAGNTWLFSKSKLSFGPYKLVGITAI